jgi:hypothetical protein
MARGVQWAFENSESPAEKRTNDAINVRKVRHAEYNGK